MNLRPTAPNIRPGPGARAPARADEESAPWPSQTTTLRRGAPRRRLGPGGRAASRSRAARRAGVGRPAARRRRRARGRRAFYARGLAARSCRPDRRYAIAQQVRFHLGAGYTVPTQLVLMPTLLLAPPALVPLLIAAGLLVGAPAALPAPRGPSVAPRLRAARAGTRLAPAASSAARGRHARARRLAGPGPRAGSLRPPSTLGFGVTARWLALGVPPQVQLRLLPLDLRRRRRPRPDRGARRRRGLDPAARRRGSCFRSWACSLFFARERQRAHRPRARARAPTAAPRCSSATCSRPTTPTRRRAQPRRRRLSLAVGDGSASTHASGATLEFAALLHDVGKIRVPDAILNKPAR